MGKIYTTLAKIKRCSPCYDGWKKLLLYLKKVGPNYNPETDTKYQPDNEPLELSEVLISNGLSDAIWCLRTIVADNPKSVRIYLGKVIERGIPVWEKWAKVKRPKDLQLVRDVANTLKAGKKPALDDYVKIVAASEAAYSDGADDAYFAARAASAGVADDDSALNVLAVTWRVIAAKADSDKEAERIFQVELFSQIFG